MKLLFSIFLLTFLSNNVIANNLRFEGKIGTYPIEMIFSKSDWTTGEIEGKYRYSSKSSFLELNGNILGNCIALVEVYKKDTTGNFYLKQKGDSLLGTWIGNTNFLVVKLAFKSGDLALLKMKAPKNFISEVTKQKSGTYKSQTYFLNDMWLTNQNLEMEVTFNGGTAIFDKIDKDSVHFQVSVVCGPTYHIGMAEGIAVKNKANDTFVYKSQIGSDDEACTITIKFSEKEVYMHAVSPFNCEFGARAFLDHTFYKTSDKIEFRNDF